MLDFRFGLSCFKGIGFAQPFEAPVSGFVFHSSGSAFRFPCCGFRFPIPIFRGSGFVVQAWDFVSRVSGFVFRVQDAEWIKNADPFLSFLVSGSGLQGSGFELRRSKGLGSAETFRRVRVCSGVSKG